MKWANEADQAIQKVPFFVRKRVKKKVEAHVRKTGGDRVELSHVNALKKQFLSKGGMEKEIKGYEVTTCFGGAGCPNTAVSCTRLGKDIEKVMAKEDILGFLKRSVRKAGEDLKFHHEFRVALADCPNACSRPQIVDIGIIGSVLPAVSAMDCTLCGNCVDVCKEKAVLLDEEKKIPVIKEDLCLACGKCIRECPTGTLEENKKGFRVMLGGRLGRHPRLGMEVPGLQTHDQVLEIVKNSLRFYKEHSKNGQRFSHILSSVDQVV